MNDAGVLERLEGQEANDKLKQAKGMLMYRRADRHLTDEQVAELEKLVATISPTGFAISAYDAAEIAKLGYLYQTIRCLQHMPP